MSSGSEDRATLDVVADRHSVVLIGLGAVGLSCLVFSALRIVVTLRTGMLTPWWGNATGLVAVAALYLWYRRAPETRSTRAAHGTALVATVALLIPVAYGMTSTIWWLSLVGFAMVLLGRPRESMLWGVAIPILVVAAVVAEPYLQVRGAAGEPPAEAALAKIVFVIVLLGMAVGFRRVAQQRALQLHESREELGKLKSAFEARALTGEGLAAQRLRWLEHLNSVLRAVRNVDQLITREQDPQRLVERACEMLVETRGYVGTWIGLAGADGTVAGWAQSGWGESFAPFARRLEQGQWPPCREKATTGVVVLDPQCTCSGCPLAEHYARGTAAIVALRHNERTYGVLGISCPSHLVMNEEERSLIAEVADDIAFALFGIVTQTARDRIVAVQRESEAKFRALFEEVPVGVLLLDQAGTILEANKAWLTLMQAAPVELVGKNAFEVAAQSGIDAEKLRTDLNDRLDGREGFSELRFVRPDGKPATISVRVAPFSAAGQVRQLLYLFDDITDLKRVEEERRQLQASLAQSDRLASMGMLAAGVAHEINNPLSYVLYNLESLSEELPRQVRQLAAVRPALERRLGGPELQKVVGASMELLEPDTWIDVTDRFKDALGGALRIKEIARGLRTFARVEQDQLAKVELRYPAESALRIAFNEIRYRAQVEKDLRSTARVMGSTGRLSQVFLNLLINAAHSIHEGDVEHNVIGIRIWQEGPTVLAEVRDTGCGIAPENLERIFEPFFTTKDSGLGSGLGLSIVRNIVAGYGGTIAVTSSVGKGTTFLIQLPAVTDEEAREPSRPVVSAEPALPGRILVIDDEDAIRRALKRILRGHELVEADSGEQARELLERDQRFDVILCDMMMPKMSGMDLHRWLVGANAQLATRVVFVTGGAFTPDGREYLDRVENRRVEKPFDSKKLREMVVELVAAARAA